VVSNRHVVDLNRQFVRVCIHAYLYIPLSQKGKKSVVSKKSYPPARQLPKIIEPVI
jgi:hypothetical protein